jgi:hypothetical protein
MSGIQIRNCAVFLVFGVSTGLIGCGPNRKQLTPSVAKTLVQEYINGRFFGLSLDKGANRLEELTVTGSLRRKAQGSVVLIKWKEVHQYMTEEWLIPIEDGIPRLADIVKALYGRGYATLERRKMTVPDLSGVYTGTDRLRVFSRALKVYIQHNGPDITGEFEIECYGAVARGYLGGSIDPKTGKVYLREREVRSGSCGGPFDGQLFDVVASGSTLKLQYIVDEWKYVTLETTWNGKMVTLEPYTFKRTDKLSALDLGGEWAEGGVLAITGCSDLVLDAIAANAAAGRCTFRVELNDLGKVLVGSEAVDGHGEVQFLRRPDGSWFAGECNFKVRR